MAKSASQRLSEKMSRQAAGRHPALKVNFVAGAGANTNIAITGITMQDELVSVIEVQPPTASSGSTFANDRTAATSITSNGNIQCTAATTGNQLLVIWYDVAGPY